MIFQRLRKINKKERKRQNRAAVAKPLSKTTRGVICPVLERLGCGISGLIGCGVKYTTADRWGVM